MGGYHKNPPIHSERGFTVHAMVYSGVPITPIYSMVIQCRFNYLVYEQTFSQTTRCNKVTTAYREGFNLANVDFKTCKESAECLQEFFLLL